tara:strand:- start:1523 stop:1660 length:138 start_codon:yes stop_codon:yes gene_type:complete
MERFLKVCSNVIDFIVGKEAVEEKKYVKPKSKPKRKYTRRKQKSK